MNDMAARLLAAIEETERLAHDAAKNEDGDPPDYEWTTKVARLQDAGWDEREVCRLDAHVAHNDPASVLRRCAADRRRLERHAPAEPGIGHFPSARFKDPDARICAHCSHDGDWGATVWPCPDFTDLMDSYGLTDQQEGETRG